MNFVVGNSPVALCARDLDADGRTDLLVANSRSNDVTVLMGTGIGSFKASPRFAAGRSPDSIVSDDFNGDGFPDRAVGDFGLRQDNLSDVSVLLGDGNGSFSTPRQQQVAPFVFSIAIGDLNGDGIIDLASTTPGQHRESMVEPPGVSILF